MTEGETLTDYGRRLRILVEDMTISGFARTLEQILSTWRRGLRPQLRDWLYLIERGFPRPGTDLELIYRLERLVVHRGGGIEIDHIAFIVSARSVRPDSPDFRIWETIQDGWIYAHDVLYDHVT